MAEEQTVLRRGAETHRLAKEVALELFSQNGYDATSLREIAERLGVTKAALYYHFASKSDIVRSLLADYLSALNDIVAWLEQEAPSPDAILDRWAMLTRAQGQQLVGLIVADPQVIREVDRTHQHTPQIDTIAGALVGATTPREIYRGRLALQTIHLVALSGAELDLGEDALFEVATHAARAILTTTEQRPR